MEVNALTRPINSSKFDNTVYIIIQFIIMEYYETLTIQITLGYRFNFGWVYINTILSNGLLWCISKE